MSSSKNTREVLLDVAWRMMRDDPTRATLSRIASEAGVSRQALYLHFNGRGGLLLEMVRWVDETERFAERVAPYATCGDPLAQLEGTVRTWLDYLPELHPVAGFLARADADAEASSAWADRMSALEGLYLGALEKLSLSHRLRGALSPAEGVDAVRATASVHAWEHLVHERGWTQQQAVDTLWNAVTGALVEPRARLS